jgi:hypothetical protein
METAMQGYRLITARFTDNAKRVVEALWVPVDVENADLTPTICIAEDNDAQWRQLLNHITIDEIHENTVRHIRQFQTDMQDVVSQIAKREGWVYDLDHEFDSQMYKATVKVLTMDFDPEKHKEQLFLLKLQLFEQNFVKDCTDKELKKRLRKAATMLEAIKAAIEIHESNQAASSAQTSG